jgi:hypothetical protein
MYPQGMNFSTTKNNVYRPRSFNVGNPNDSIVYRITIPMPAGITFNKNTGEIAGKPQIPFGTIQFTVFSQCNTTSYARNVAISCNQ